MNSQEKNKQLRVCRRCLLLDMKEAAEYKSVYDYISRLPREQMAPQPEYERRLAICRECDRLNSGVCASCGCFVEVRAIKKDMYCPNENHYW